MQDQSCQFCSVGIRMALHNRSLTFNSYQFCNQHPIQLSDSGVLWINLYLLADMADVYCHCIIRSDRILIPDALINLVDGKYFSLVLHQQ